MDNWYFFICVKALSRCLGACPRGQWAVAGKTPFKWKKPWAGPGWYWDGRCWRLLGKGGGEGEVGKRRRTKKKRRVTNIIGAKTKPKSVIWKVEDKNPGQQGQQVSYAWTINIGETFSSTFLLTFPGAIPHYPPWPWLGKETTEDEDEEIPALNLWILWYFLLKRKRFVLMKWLTNRKLNMWPQMLQVISGQEIAWDRVPLLYL